MLFVKGLSIRQAWLARRSYYKIAGHNRLIDYPKWKKSLRIKNDSFARRLFELVDADHSGFIDCNEFLKFIGILLNRDLRKQLSFVFKIYDVDKDGALNRKEIKQVLQASLSEQELTLADSSITSLVNAFIRKVDKSDNGEVLKKDFISVVSRYPGIKNQFNQFASNWVSVSKRRRKFSHKAAPLRARLKRFLHEKWTYWFWGLVYIGANAYCFMYAVNEYSMAGADLVVQIARGAGACLYLNSALILLPVCHGIWSQLRLTFLKYIIPVDDFIKLHKIMALAIILFSMLHVGAHIYNYRASNTDLLYILFFTEIGLTGLLISYILYLMGNGYRVKKSRREYFAMTHILYAGFIIGLLFHGKDYWVWLLLPACIFLCDSLIRAFVKTRSLKVFSMKAFPDGVTHITLEKPKRLSFSPGDYLWLKIPAISRWQWHPFTISAAPEATQFAVHVRSNGDWSAALHNLSRKKGLSARGLPVKIDGPYSAPASHIEQSKVAIFVAAGIGVTPFASVLQSILLRERRNNAKGDSEQIIYFHWLNRSQSSYDWFMDLLSNAERRLGEDRFHLYIHLTSLSHNLSNIAMQLAIDEYREKHNRDPLTSLKAITAAGRPNWNKLFFDVAMQHSTKNVDVYFCGPPGLGKILSRVSKRYGFYYYQEKFD